MVDLRYFLSLSAVSKLPVVLSQLFPLLFIVQRAQCDSSEIFHPSLTARLDAFYSRNLLDLYPVVCYDFFLALLIRQVIGGLQQLRRGCLTPIKTTCECHGVASRVPGFLNCKICCTTMCMWVILGVTPKNISEKGIVRDRIQQ